MQKLFEQKSVPYQLHDLLVGRNLEVSIYDKDSNPIVDPNDAEVLVFKFRTSTNAYGTVVITVDDTHDDDGKYLKVHYDSSLTDDMKREDKVVWRDFLHQLKSFSARNSLDFQPTNMSKLKYTMRGMAAMTESYYGNKKTSYTDLPENTRIMIKHSKSIEEGEQRYRHIDSIFVENADGERFKLDTKSLRCAKAMARHISEGGKPYDDFGKHLTELGEEMLSLGKYKRVAAKQEVLDEAAIEKLQTTKRTLESISRKRGYMNYKSNWDKQLDEARFDIELTKDNHAHDALSGKYNKPSRITKTDFTDFKTWQEFARKASYAVEFVKKNTNMGELIIAKDPHGPIGSFSVSNNSGVIGESRKGNKMKEVEMFESWANSIVEGTWAISGDEDEFKHIMSSPISGEDASELLYDVIGDDVLHDALADLSRRDPEADARPVVSDWLKANQHLPNAKELMASIETAMTSHETDEPDEDAIPDLDDESMDSIDDYGDSDEPIHDEKPKREKHDVSESESSLNTLRTLVERLR